MRVKLFTFRYSSTLGGFDDRPLQAFLRDREVIACREHYFQVNDVPHLACVLIWQEAVVTEDNDRPRDDRPRERARGAKSQAREDPTARLDEAGRRVFATLREWRRDRAREEGVPPYVVFTNRELVAIVETRPDSLTALGQVSGVGAGKVERYGRALLENLADCTAESSRHPTAQEPTP
ncbi:HRDC domain-containing protein [Engelhardtia mirabilis]|uniref:ATP-dependent DNA helicase RecQ n=1 Tax=Engelhardtia mirabilis TaxID=2528011 RepID=A0A518BRD4_9BACT|nr:ATP-dependent DNA helicase RecQ [Planctomycetes bacterium Pla133]QDV03860.1 ATP-dependent DNA helicase RecQ [Planctomycetes bacterium Pla86]